MKVIVLFKIVKDYEKVLPRDWQEEILPAFDYVGNVINCYDEAALEIALRLKDKNPELNLTALTIGQLDNYTATSLYAVGYDNVVCINNDDDNIDLSETLIKNDIADYDVIITGVLENGWESGVLPYELAYKLNRKINASVCDQNSIEINDKCVISIGDTDIVGLRMATLRARKLAQDKAFTTINSSVIKDIKNKKVNEIPYIRERKLLKDYKNNSLDATKEIVASISEVTE